MKKFSIKIVLFACLIFIVLLSLINLYRGEIKLFRETHYLKSIIDKHKLLDSTPSPRIIIAGGSNNAFGINSELIEDEFGLPVVNLTITGGLGLPFILGELESNIREEDIIFLSVEYLMGEGKEYLKRTYTGFPEIVQYSNYYSTVDKLLIPIFTSLSLAKENILKKIKSFIPYKNAKTVNPKKFNSNKKFIYQRKGETFNNNGDFIGHLNQKSRLEKAVKPKRDYRYWEGISNLNEFNKFAIENNSFIFYFFPTYAKSYFLRDLETIKASSLDLKNDLEIEIINEPESFVYEDSLFFDTRYHLTGKGRHIRTMDMINLLKQNESFNHVLLQSKLDSSN